VRRGLEQGRAELNETRRRLGLPAHDHVHNGISRALSMVGTFPQLEYPFPRPPESHIVGPLLWEPAFGEVELPPGDGPLVLVAPSTAQDASHRLLRATLAGLADEPVRVLATWNRRTPDPPLGPVPANARVVEWLSYARTMPRCDLVVCHGGHGTVVRALASGCPIVAAPAAGDMNENAARVAWAAAGVRLPRRLVSARTVRLAVVRALADPSITARAGELAAWAGEHDGAQRAGELVEAFAADLSIQS
jgi:UDP:flavonoid glycosyltransferase YjiC (YdhE family)